MEYYGSNDQESLIDSCYNTGEIVTKAYLKESPSGGISGISTASSIIRNCYNYGTIIQQNIGLTGGITGRIYSGPAELRYSN